MGAPYHQEQRNKAVRCHRSIRRVDLSMLLAGVSPGKQLMPLNVLLFFSFTPLFYLHFNMYPAWLYA